ncbi:hypothetical protein SALBM311S_09673 [Streptomyces alboniger]
MLRADSPASRNAASISPSTSSAGAPLEARTDDEDASAQRNRAAPARRPARSVSRITFAHFFR